MSRKRFGAGAVLAAVLLAGCAAAGEFVVDNGSFRVEFVDPNDPQLGCRFLRAGWIRSLHPAGSRESIFVTESLFGFHPAFGYACEIYPALDLKRCRSASVSSNGIRSPATIPARLSCSRGKSAGKCGKEKRL